MEEFLARRLRGGAAVEGFGEERGEQVLVNGSGCGECAVTVVALPAAGDAAGEDVDECVGRARVEGDGVLTGGDDGDVRDSAEVEHRGRSLDVGEQKGIEEPDERGALSHGGDVTGADVGEHGDSEAFGDERRLPELEGRGDASIGDVVTDRLPVADDEVG